MKAQRVSGSIRLLLTSLAAAVFVSLKVGAYFPANAATGDCSTGSKIFSEGWIEKLADGQLYTCTAGKWVRVALAVISVEDSDYGTACCGAMKTVGNAKAACDQKQECSIPATNGWAGRDPVPNKPKHLWVRYHCEKSGQPIPNTTNTIDVQEGETIKISCSQY